tara:strand:- start:3244 stop:3897 length:654 start_codon:yes stop_codon:yes gene_type:complete
MVDCRYKRNKKKKVCENKKKKKGKKKITQKQSQKQTVNIHIHQKKTKRKTRGTKKQHPYIPRVNAGASHIPLIINNVPQRTHDGYLMNQLKQDLNERFASQEQKIDNLFEFQKMKFGEHIAMQNKVKQMEQEQVMFEDEAKKAMIKIRDMAREEGIYEGREIEKAETKKKKSASAKKGWEKRRQNAPSSVSTDTFMAQNFEAINLEPKTQSIDTEDL